jgi:hypothetical protein
MSNGTELQTKKDVAGTGTEENVPITEAGSDYVGTSLHYYSVASNDTCIVSPDSIKRERSVTIDKNGVKNTVNLFGREVPEPSDPQVDLEYFEAEALSFAVMRGWRPHEFMDALYNRFWHLRNLGEGHSKNLSDVANKISTDSIKSALGGNDENRTPSNPYTVIGDSDGKQTPRYNRASGDGGQTLTTGAAEIQNLKKELVALNGQQGVYFSARGGLRFVVLITDGDWRTCDAVTERWLACVDQQVDVEVDVDIYSDSKPASYARAGYQLVT